MQLVFADKLLFSGDFFALGRKENRIIQEVIEWDSFCLLSNCEAFMVWQQSFGEQLEQTTNKTKIRTRGAFNNS